MNRLFTHPFRFQLSALACAVGGAFLVAACSPGFQSASFQPTDFVTKPAPAQTPSIEAQEATSKPSQEIDADQSDTLADEGEAMLEPKKFSQAYGKFNEALAKNPDNARAIFWTSFLKPMLELKGILQRVRPVFLQAELGSVRYADFVNRMTAQTHPSYVSFLRDGPEDIHNARELQDWIDRFNAAIGDFRLGLKRIRDREITVLLPQTLTPSFVLWTKRFNCTETRFGPVHFQGLDSNGCSGGGPSQIGLNRADFEALISYAAAYQAYLDVLNAYRINPSVFLAKDIQQVNTRQEAQNAIRTVLGDDGGTLRSKTHFMGLRDLSADALSAWQYMLENQKEVCPRGQFAPENRKGYLFSFGYCLNANDESARSMQQIEMALSGKSVSAADDRLSIYVTKFLDEPLQDLKSLAPVTLNACGRLTKLNSRALKPYLERGDFNDYLDVRNRTAEPCPIKEEKP